MKHRPRAAKREKPTDDNILRLLAPSFVGMLLCMVCLAGSTWAWFSASIRTSPQTIEAANYAISVEVTDETDHPVEKTQGGYTLLADTAYRVTLTAEGSANQFGGYCVVQGGDTPLYTTPLSPGDTLSFTLIPNKTAPYTFTAVWGKTDQTTDISDGEIIGQTQPGPGPEPSSPPAAKANKPVPAKQQPAVPPAEEPSAPASTEPEPSDPPMDEPTAPAPTEQEPSEPPPAVLPDDGQPPGTQPEPTDGQEDSIE